MRGAPCGDNGDESHVKKVLAVGWGDNGGRSPLCCFSCFYYCL